MELLNCSFPTYEECFSNIELSPPEKYEEPKTTLLVSDIPLTLNFDSLLWRRIKEPNGFFRRVGDFRDDLTKEINLASRLGKSHHPVISLLSSGFLALDWDVKDTSKIEELSSYAIIVTTPSYKKKALFHVQIDGPTKVQDLEEYIQLILNYCNFDCSFDRKMAAMTLMFLSRETFENPPIIIPKTFFIHKEVSLINKPHEWKMPTNNLKIETLIYNLKESSRQKREMLKIVLFMVGNLNFIKGMDLPQDYLVQTFKRVFPDEVHHQAYISEALKLLRKNRLIQCIDKSSLKKGKTYRVINDLAKIFKDLPRRPPLPTPEKMLIEDGTWNRELGKLVYYFHTQEKYLKYVSITK